MHFKSIVASLLAIAPLVASHDNPIPGAPKIFGRRVNDDLKSRQTFGKRSNSLPRSHHLHKRGRLHERANTDGQCGKGFGNCAAGYCCSSAGWCGQGKDYCQAPDCQFNYGPACDANTVPPGDSTASVPRPKNGSPLWGGAGIYDCTVPNMIALTYDDGPYIYTDAMLDILKKYGVKATFFITGNNLGKGSIDNAYYPWVNVIKRMYSEGHQIASHTWSHQDLSTEVTAAQRLNQMHYLEMAVRNILGFFPTYMRPPYSSCTSASGCQKAMGDLGYHVTYFDLDTEDYLNTLPTQIQTAKNDFSGNLTTRDPATQDWLVIAHDIHQQTALNLTEFMITTALSKGWKFGTVGECLNDPPANWYRSSSGSVYTSAPGSAATTAAGTKSSSGSTKTTSTKSTATPTGVSEDASCGGTTGLTCLNSGFGNCCSRAGWCGPSIDYCGDGCQAGFGNCGASAVITLSSASSTSTSSTPPAASPTKVSLDGSCAGTTGQTCQGSTFGNCCSPAGYCGSSAAYCGDGCQSLFGSCGSAASSSSSVRSSSTSSISTRNVVVTSSSTSSSSVLPSSSSSSSRLSSSSSSSSAVLPSSSSTTSSVRSSSSSSSLVSSSSSSVILPPSSSSTSTKSSSVAAADISSSSSSTSARTSSTSSSSSSSSRSSSSSSSSSVRSSSSSSSSFSSSFSISSSAAAPSSTSPSSSSSSTLSTRVTNASSLLASKSTTSTSSTKIPSTGIKVTAPTPSIVKSTNGACGKAAGQTCDGYAWGSCCSVGNKCTNDMFSCFQFMGCQDDYGACWSF